jgi:hypothetical protein
MTIYIAREHRNRVLVRVFGEVLRRWSIALVIGRKDRGLL